MKKLLWKNQYQRPELYQCISDFRTWSYRDFQSGVIGEGSLKIAKIPRDSNQECYQYDLSRHYEEVELLKSLSQTERLNPVFLKYSDFIIAQYEQMVVKTAVGSLTALHDCTNGELLKMEHTYQILSYVIDDCLRIISKHEPTLWNTSSTSTALSKGRLVELCISFLRTTQGESSMLRKQVNVWNASDVMNTTGYFAYIARQEKVFAPHINMMNKILEDRISLAHSRGNRVSIGDDDNL
jgi:ketopantoate reductase